MPATPVSVPAFIVFPEDLDSIEAMLEPLPEEAWRITALTAEGRIALGAVRDRLSTTPPE